MVSQLLKRRDVCISLNNTTFCKFALLETFQLPLSHTCILSPVLKIDSCLNISQQFELLQSSNYNSFNNYVNNTLMEIYNDTSLHIIPHYFHSLVIVCTNNINIGLYTAGFQQAPEINSLEDRYVDEKLWLNCTIK